MIILPFASFLFALSAKEGSKSIWENGNCHTFYDLPVEPFLNHMMTNTDGQTEEAAPDGELVFI
jgi:hypothetical protein